LRVNFGTVQFLDFAERFLPLFDASLLTLESRQFRRLFFFLGGAFIKPVSMPILLDMLTSLLWAGL